MSFRFPRFGRRKKKTQSNADIHGNGPCSTTTSKYDTDTDTILSSTIPPASAPTHLAQSMRNFPSASNRTHESELNASRELNAHTKRSNFLKHHHSSSMVDFGSKLSDRNAKHHASYANVADSSQATESDRVIIGTSPLVFDHPLYEMNNDGMVTLRATGIPLQGADLAVHQDELMNAVVQYVHESMRTELHFQEEYIPAPDSPVKANVFVSHNYKTCERLLIFVAVSRNLQPGLWSRGLVLHAGVKSGSMLEYFRKALQEGYGIIVTNPNKNVAVSLDGNERAPIPGSASPEQHMDSVWDCYVNNSAARRVYFLGYSYGGVLIKYLLQSRGDQLLTRNGAIALIESSHRIEDRDSHLVKDELAHRTLYWESNDAPFQTQLEGDAPHRTGCTCLSAGRPPRMHSNHYYVTAFCIQNIRNVLFRFLEVRDPNIFVQQDCASVLMPSTTIASASIHTTNLTSDANTTTIPTGGTALTAYERNGTRREIKLNAANVAASEKHCNLCLFHFTLFDRRHHCRMCHRAVCNACSRDRLFLPGSSTAQRVCTECASDGPRRLASQNSMDVARTARTQSDANSTLFEARLRSDTQMSEQNRTMQKNSKLSVEDFELLKVIGKGAFGKVMLVRKRVTDATSSSPIYAMKVLKKASVFAKNQVEHTKSERRILRDIDHPFVVRLRFAFQTEDKLYLVMDYYSGGSLFFHLRKCKKFSEKQARFYSAQLLLSMAHLHELNIAYRDLKLENILMDDQGFIALTDFGLSKENVDMPDGAKTFCGTAEYIAPELLQGLPYGKPVDWWGFGTLLYEMMTGQTPFFDRNRKRMFHNILHREVVFTQVFSEEAKDLLSGLLRRDPAKRLGSGPMEAQEIMDHPFFATIDFDRLLKRDVEPPFKPIVTNEVDTTNVANIFTREIARDSPVTQELGATHRAQAHFEDFTYVPTSELHR